jgi:hypothetical protein
MMSIVWSTYPTSAATIVSRRGSNARCSLDCMAPKIISGLSTSCRRASDERSPDDRSRSRSPSWASMAVGSGRNAAAWARSRSRRGSATNGTASAAWNTISWTQTHNRNSSRGRLQSVPKASMLCGHTSNSSRPVVARGIGRSNDPNARAARCPTMLPADIVAMAGAMAVRNCWSHAAMGSSSSSTMVERESVEPIEVVTASRRGRYASRVRSAQVARVVASTMGGRPVWPDTSSPVVWATCSSATRPSSSKAMRTDGSTLGSPWPPVANEAATCLAESHPGRCDDSSCISSASSGIASNGSSPSGPESLMGAS